MSYDSLGTSIDFVDQATVVPTVWVQDVNNVVYELLGNGTNAPTSVPDILQSLGIGASAIARITISATAGQVLFTGIPAYVIGQNTLSVYINGAKQPPSSYTETSTTSVTFSTGAVSTGDLYEFEVLQNVVLAGGYVLPVATTTVLGGVKQGTGCTIAPDGTLNVPVSSGTVSSVGLSLPGIFNVTGSPVTTAGTLTATLNSQTANTFFSAPNGSSGVPTFRAIVAADIPTLNQNTTGTASNVTGTVAIANGGTGLTSGGTANQVLGMNNGASGLEYKTITAGANVTVTHGANSITIASTGGGGGSGTVTSVGLSAPGIFSVSGSPVTTSGTLSFALTSQTANTVWAAPDGSAGNPAFRSLVNADLPTVATTKGGTGLTSIGTTNQILGVNSGASGLEYKSLVAGSNVTITHGAGSVTIASTGGGGGLSSVNDDVLFWMSV